MNYRVVHFLVLLVLTYFSTVAQAKPISWDIIPEESELTFIATQNNEPVRGYFKRFTAHLIADEDNLEHSSIEVIIDITSVSASYPEIKNILLTPDWFNPSLFPQAAFKSTRINKIGKNTYKASGYLTLRDKTMPVVLTYAASFPGARKAVVIGQTFLNRSDFNLGQGEWAGLDQIKNGITIEFKVVATHQ